jgi:hypothetical protein
MVPDRGHHAIVTWMTEYLDLAVTARRAQGIQIDDEVLAHISPAHNEPVQFFGSIPIEVDKELAQLDQAGYRPLRLRAGELLGSGPVS